MPIGATPNSHSRNAIKFALTGTAFLAPHDREEDFEKILATVTDQYFPETDAEKLIIREVAIATWRLAKIPFAETAVLAKGRHDNKDLFKGIVDDYQRTLVREGDALMRCSKELT